MLIQNLMYSRIDIEFVYASDIIVNVNTIRFNTIQKFL